ncbi:Fibronectin type III domain-containing protein [Lachnospiraceae bacterium]|nr:Fibronectin type III domain-containing protein [Lachnospiraceae bacterium]
MIGGFINETKNGRFIKCAISFALTGAMVLGVVPMPFGAGSIETFADDDGVFITWYDTGGNIQVDTGLGNGTNTEGFWYVMTDEGKGGNSRIDWDCDEPDENGSIINGNIENGSLSGTAVLDKGTLTCNPYVYICFDVVGLGENSMPVPGDASGWGGLSISYYCDAAPSLELSLGDFDAEIGYANPAAALAKSTNGTVKTLAWSDFKQPSWYKGVTKISGPDAAKQLVSVRFKIQAYSGSYHFRICGVGDYDAHLPFPNSNIYGPTPTPIATPTVEPTASPSATPTAEPTATPTVEPTASPSATPTAEPTATPTVEPTASPSATPTAEPTATPTVEPTASPSATPTAEPTATPTVEPTASPSATPTAEPTASPSATPTAEPTATPTSTVKPTATATITPTVTPTTKPTPTVTPTVTPTKEPTPTVTPEQTVEKPKTPTLKSVKNKKTKKMTITWKKVKDVKGYQVQYALDKDFTDTLKTKSLTDTSLTVKKLKKKKTYYVRVRSYVKDSNNKKVYSKWSKVKKVKIKK